MRTSSLGRNVRAGERSTGRHETHALTHIASTAEIRAILDRGESGTPGGAPLHAQLDAVRTWLGALDRPDDQDRFGGAAHLHAHVTTQLRLVVGALEDYQRTRRS